MDTIDYVYFRAVSGIGSWLWYMYNFTIVAASDDFFIKKTKPRVRALQARYFLLYLQPEDINGDGESKIRAFFNWVIKIKPPILLPLKIRYC
jgi:hypothetical protein